MPKAIEAFAKELAGDFLGRACACHNDEFPSSSCDRRIVEVGAAIGVAYGVNLDAETLAGVLLTDHCACYAETKDLGVAECDKLNAGARDRGEQILRAAFDQRHMDDAFADALASDVRGG